MKFQNTVLANEEGLSRPGGRVPILTKGAHTLGARRAGRLSPPLSEFGAGVGGVALRRSAHLDTRTSIFVALREGVPLINLGYDTAPKLHGPVWRLLVPVCRTVPVVPAHTHANVNRAVAHLGALASSRDAGRDVTDPPQHSPIRLFY